MLRCLKQTCVPERDTLPFEFDPARVTSSTARGGRPADDEARVAAADRPLTHRAGDLATAAPGGSTDTTLPEPSYRAAPGLLLALLVGGSLLLLGIAGGGARLRRLAAGVSRAGAGARAGAVRSLTPLERALELLEDAARANGAADQRRSLELVAEVLAERGEEDGLARAARELAWSPTPPPPAATKGLAARVRAALDEELRQLEAGAAAEEGAAARRRGGPCAALTRWMAALPAVGTPRRPLVPRGLAARARAPRALRRRRGGPARGRRRERARPRPARSRPAADRHDRRRRARPLALDPRRPVGCRAADAPGARSTPTHRSASSSSRTLPYELLPPGTPPTELRPIIRLLTPNAGGKVSAPGRTRSAAARGSRPRSSSRKDMLVGDRVKDGSILLVSDLETAPDDVPATAKVLRTIQQVGIPVHLLALGPSSDARRSSAASSAPARSRRSPRVPSARPSPPTPSAGRCRRRCSCSGCSSCVALAAHERYAGRLALPRAPVSGGAA